MKYAMCVVGLAALVAYLLTRRRDPWAEPWPMYRWPDAEGEALEPDPYLLRLRGECE